MRWRKVIELSPKENTPSVFRWIDTKNVFRKTLKTLRDENGNIGGLPLLEWLDESAEINIDIEKEAKYFVVSKQMYNKSTFSQSALIELLKQFGEHLQSSLPSSSVTGGEDFNDPFINKHLAVIREKTIESLVHTHIEVMGELEKSSVKYFLETGKVNGSFMERIKTMMITFAKNWNKSADALPVTGESEAIGFAEWISNNQFFMYDDVWESTKIHYSGVSYTTSELYNLYKQSKK